MTLTHKAAFALVIALGFMLAILAIQINFTPRAQGSVSRFSEYQATTTRSFAGTPMVNLQNITATTTVTPGTLGSVVITGAGAGTMNFYDATTTDVTQRATSAATSTILLASFPVSATAQTYTFDTLFRNGLIVEIIGTTPTSTITWRQN